MPTVHPRVPGIHRFEFATPDGVMGGRPACKTVGRRHRFRHVHSNRRCPLTTIPDDNPDIGANDMPALTA